jgi:hypothetical protein
MTKRLKALEASRCQDMEFNHAAAQIGEAMKGGEVSLDDIQAITADAQRIAADLNGFGRVSAVVTEPAEAAKPVEVKKRIPGTLRDGCEAAFAEKETIRPPWLCRGTRARWGSVTRPGNAPRSSATRR